MEVVIDNREGELYSTLNEYDFSKVNASVKLQQLSVGDIQIIINSKIFLIIERKTVKDLCASITDGRYREQKMRILSTKTPLRPIYLVEGLAGYSLFEPKIERLNTSAVISSMTNSMTRDQIMVYHTQNVDESAKIVHAFAKSLNANLEIIASQMIGGETRELNYTDAIKTVKKANITKRIAFIEMLCTIPGFSKKRAEPLVTKYTNMKTLIAIIDTGKSDEIKKTAGIGKVLYERLIEFLTT